MSRPSKRARLAEELCVLCAAQGLEDAFVRPVCTPCGHVICTLCSDALHMAEAEQCPVCLHSPVTVAAHVTSPAFEVWLAEEEGQLPAGQLPAGLAAQVDATQASGTNTLQVLRAQVASWPKVLARHMAKERKAVALLHAALDRRHDLYAAAAVAASSAYVKNMEAARDAVKLTASMVEQTSRMAAAAHATADAARAADATAVLHRALAAAVIPVPARPFMVFCHVPVLNALSLASVQGQFPEYCARDALDLVCNKLESDPVFDARAFVTPLREFGHLKWFFSHYLNKLLDCVFGRDAEVAVLAVDLQAFAAAGWVPAFAAALAANASHFRVAINACRLVARLLPTSSATLQPLIPSLRNLCLFTNEEYEDCFFCTALDNFLAPM